VKNLKKIYDSISKKIDEVDFNEIVNGFDCCSYALFNEDIAIIDGREIVKPE